MDTKRRPSSGLARWMLIASVSAMAAGTSGASPSAQFGSPQVLLSGRAILFDEAKDPAMGPALSAALQRLYADLYGRAGWRVLFDERRPLRLYISRRGADGIRPNAFGWIEGGPLAGPALILDENGLTTPQIVREVAREIVRATLSTYGAPEDPFLTSALVEALSRDPADTSEDEEVWAQAAAPVLDFRANPSTLGRLWIEEIVRDRGGDSAFLRLAWERAAASGEAPLALIIRMLAEASGPREEALLVRCAARLYAAVEPEAAPSRLRRFDLEAGALDAAAPRALSVSHRSFLPEESQDMLRVTWPEDGGAGAAVVRYRDALLPADVVFFNPGDVRRIPLPGVSRVDWVVAGSPAGGQGIRAPASFEISRMNVFTGLEVRAVSGPERPRLTWRTATHERLWGWAVFREELGSDGRIVRTGPQIVPSSESSEDSFGYVYVDSGASAGTYYHYTVWAVADEGLLVRAFAVTLRAGE